MKPILRTYNFICSSRYQSLGFVQYGPIFAKRDCDLLYSFSLKQLNSTARCTIEFGIFPICMPTPIFLEAGGYELDRFFAADDLFAVGWPFESYSKTSRVHCITSLVNGIDMHLLPFFKSSSDCTTALAELIKLEELFDCNRRKVLRMNGWSDHARPWQERSLFDERKYYMALKAHNFSYAKQYLEHQTNFLQSKLRKTNTPNSVKQPESVLVNLTNRLREMTIQLEKIKAGDYLYFDLLVKNNEDDMLKYLLLKYPGL